MKKVSTKEYFEISELRPPLLSLPMLEASEQISFEVIGSSGDRYVVNLVEMSCTCPDWTESRIRFARPDIRRACKHIAKQISFDRFVLKGERLAGRLVPIPAVEYRLGCIEVDESIVIFRCASMRRWHFEVVAPFKDTDRSETYANFFTDMYGWSDRRVPKYSDEIKRFLRKWLKKQPEFEEELPPLPNSALEAMEKKFAELETDLQRCYVCYYQLSFPIAPPETVQITCPQCETVNILTRKERTNTPERMALYRKYDGDIHGKTIEGLLVFALRHFEGNLQTLREFKREGRITEYEFEHQARDNNLSKAKRLEELESQKALELEIIKGIEREARKKCRKD